MFADRFTTFTKATATIYKENSSFLHFGLPPIEIESRKHSGVNYLKEIQKHEKKQPEKKIKNILYVMKCYRGERQNPFYVLPDDFVYLEWNIRLVETLSNAGFEILIKHHPEGKLNGSPFKFSRYGKFLDGRIPVEKIWDEADVLLFDMGGSSFWYALCWQTPLF